LVRRVEDPVEIQTRYLRITSNLTCSTWRHCEFVDHVKHKSYETLVRTHKNYTNTIRHVFPAPVK